MNPKSPFSAPPIAALTMIAAAALSTSGQAVAQSPPAKPPTTWQDLGFNQLPEGVSTDTIPLFEGLNEARGTWSFEGKATDGDAATPLAGSLHVTGNPKSGMVPIWKMTWGWPADEPGHAIIHTIMASPGKSGFELMLVRVGPVKNPGADQAKPGVPPTMFRGSWNLKNRTITWTERALPAGLPGQPAEKDSSKPKGTIEMVVPADGKISFQNGKHAPRGQLTSGKATVRTAKTPVEPVTLTGKHNFRTTAEISDQRIKPCLPQQATDISLLSERGGHFARYKVAEADFMKFLDELWEARKDSSAHQRDRMGGEGEPAKRERMAQHFKATGWEPLDNATIYHSPSKRSGAMTTYYYDRDAGIAFHNTGYW